MSSRTPRLRVVVQAIAWGTVLLVGLLLFGQRLGPSEGDALAAPAPTPPWPAPPVAASATVEPGDAGPSPTAVAPVDAGPPHDATADGGVAETMAPIDLATAPDGGVPYHPTGTKYRSPFAKPGAGKTLRINVGFLLNSVDDYDVKTGTFTADFFLSMTSATAMPSLTLGSPNGHLEDTKVLADRPTFKLFRFAGSFKSPPDLRSYPFDKQQLRIMLEDDLHGSDQIRFVVDKQRTQLARGFRALGWQVDFVEARSLSQSYPDRFEGDDLYYGRYIFTVGVQRFATSAAFKVFVPAFVIVLIALLGMWVPPTEMEVRANSGAPMLAGAVLFHFALMQELPPTSYLTRADKLMLAVYASLALGMLSTWFMFLVRSEKQRMLVFRISKVAVPVLSALTMALGSLG
jgi:hypothetical protein